MEFWIRVYFASVFVGEKQLACLLLLYLKYVSMLASRIGAFLQFETKYNAVLTLQILICHQEFKISRKAKLTSNLPALPIHNGQDLIGLL